MDMNNFKQIALMLISAEGKAIINWDNLTITTDEVVFEFDGLGNLLSVKAIDENKADYLCHFLVYLNKKGLINDYDFDYEKEAKKYLKKLNWLET